MQDVTDLPFWQLMTRYGGADVYYTEYFRVHVDSKLDKTILSSITENPTGRPVIAQLIGNDIPALTRSARELEQHNVAAVDLNLGCPAPIVYKKCAGGGLLREPDRIDRILGAMREAIVGKFTVKTRLGFDDEATLDVLLPIFAKHNIDLLTVHGRTVAQMYREGVNYERIGQAAAAMKCPVLANGNIYSPQGAADVVRDTGVRGLMIGRGAIRNPWIFSQIRQHYANETVWLPTGRDVLAYLVELYDAVTQPNVRELDQVQKMKKYLGFVGSGVEPTGQFLHEIRRVTTKADFFSTCVKYLDHADPMPLTPFAGAV
jgi:tRNA-dihydrouridine synthase B